jgi:hypothetical protein
LDTRGITQARNIEILETIFPLPLLKGGKIEMLEKIFPSLLKGEKHGDTREDFYLHY